jgi:aminoglycoside N3'-acetyltransferase
VQIKAEKGASVFVNIRDVDQRIAPAEKDSFVNIEPRVRNNDEFARMMKWVKLNEERRDAAMADERAELAKLRQQVSQQSSEQGQEPVPEAQSEQVEGDDATGATTAE